MIYRDFIREKSHHLTRVKSAQGYPCEFDNSVGRALKDYKIYGNSIQDGTPTPKSLVEVQSVGDRTPQLFNLPTSGEISWHANSSGLAPKGIRNPDGSITFDGTNGDDVIKNMQKIFGDSEKMIIEETGVYAFSCKNASSAIYMTCRLPNGSGGFAYQTIATSSRVVYATIEQGTEITVYLQVGKNASVSNLTLYPMMQKVNAEGDAVSDFEPYHKYAVPVKVCGKNLIPYPYYNTTKTLLGVTWTDNGDGTITTSGTPTGLSSFFIANRLSVCKNTQYCFSGIDGTSNIMLSATLYAKDGTYLNEFTTYTNQNSLTFDTTDYPSAAYVRLLSKRRSNNVAVSGTIKPQLEIGSTATAYEPYSGETTHIYLNEPLRKVGDYADYIDFKKGTVVRNVVELNLLSKQVVELYTYNGTAGIRTNAVLRGNMRRMSGACNRVETGNIGECYGTNSMWLGDGNPFIYWIGILDILGLSTLNEFKEWLDNNPTYIYYGFKSSAEEDIELPKILTQKGSNIITAATAIEPSNIQVKYIAK